MAQLVLDRVTKIYPGNVLGVEEINLEVQDRELVVIVGPSGCGKTTTLRLIAGLEQITRGAICIGGQTVSRWPPQDRNVSMVFQDYALYPHMSVFGNMAFGLRLRRRASGLSSAEIKRRVMVVADALRLTELLGRMPRQLSGGERQRVAFGRAMVREPGVFLLDEPFSGLDAPLRLELRRELVAWRQRIAAPMVYVTHDQAEAASLGDRTVMMHVGRVQQVGTWQELYDRPVNRIVAEFIGMPPMNFVDGHIVIEEGAARFVTAAVVLQLPVAMRDCCRNLAGRDAVLGLRSEAISCVAVTPNRTRLVGEVESLECHGSQWHARVRVGKQSFVCSTNTSTWERGDPVELVFDMTRCHMFDAAGRNIAIGIEKSSPAG